MPNSSEEHPPWAYSSKISAPLGAVVFTLLLSATVVGLRIYTRHFVNKRLWIDDYFATISLFMIFGTGVAISLMTQSGLGRHTEVLSDGDIKLYLRSYFVAIVLYSLSLFTIKMTFLFQYLKMLGRGWVWHYKFLACMVFIGFWSLSEFWINVFVCSPTAGFWDPAIPAACIPEVPHRYIYVAGDIITATVIFFLPAMFMRNFVLGRPEAVVLGFIYFLGLFVVVLQFVRIRYVDLGDDFTWMNADRAALMMTELSLALFCACVPLLHPLAGRFIPDWFCILNYDNPDHPNANYSPSSSRSGSDIGRSSPFGSQARRQPSVSFLGFSPITEKSWSPKRAWSPNKRQRSKPKSSLRPTKRGSGGGGRQGDTGIPPRSNHPVAYDSDLFPRRAPGDVSVLEPQTHLDDSGDLSEEILGLHSTRKAMKRLSYIRSLSESDVNATVSGVAAEVPRQGVGVGVEGRPRTTPPVSPLPPSLKAGRAGMTRPGSTAPTTAGTVAGGMAESERDNSDKSVKLEEARVVVVRPPAAFARPRSTFIHGAGGNRNSCVGMISDLPPPQVHVTRGFGISAEEYWPVLRPQMGQRFATTS